MLLRYGADPSRPCVGGSEHGDVLFDDMICGGDLQVTLDAPLLARYLETTIHSF